MHEFSFERFKRGFRMNNLDVANQDLTILPKAPTLKPLTWSHVVAKSCLCTVVCNFIIPISAFYITIFVYQTFFPCNCENDAGGGFIVFGAAMIAGITGLILSMVYILRLVYKKLNRENSRVFIPMVFMSIGPIYLIGKMSSWEIETFWVGALIVGAGSLYFLFLAVAWEILKFIAQESIGWSKRFNSEHSVD